MIPEYLDPEKDWPDAVNGENADDLLLLGHEKHKRMKMHSRPVCVCVCWSKGHLRGKVLNTIENCQPNLRNSTVLMKWQNRTSLTRSKIRRLRALEKHYDHYWKQTKEDIRVTEWYYAISCKQLEKWSFRNRPNRRLRHMMKKRTGNNIRNGTVFQGKGGKRLHTAA